MTDLFRRTLLMGLGALSATREKAESLAEELVKKGSIGREEAGEFVDQLLAKGEEQQENLKQLIGKEFDLMRSKMGLATKKDLQKLEERIARLEAMISKENGE